MQYMLMIFDDEKRFETLAEAQRGKLMQEYTELTQGIVKSGAIRAGSQLQATATATTLREKNGRTVVIDGPFAETKEQLGGYYLVESCPPRAPSCCGASAAATRRRARTARLWRWSPTTPSGDTSSAASPR